MRAGAGNRDGLEAGGWSIVRLEARGCAGLGCRQGLEAVVSMGRRLALESGAAMGGRLGLAQR